jgi:general secretion pathway protein K
MIAAAAAREGEKGAALVTVLVMLVLLSALALVVVDAANASLHRTINQRHADDARWRLLAGEQIAARQLAQLLEVEPSAWQGRERAFPLQGANLTLTLWDASNCLDLNAIADADAPVAAEAQRRVARLVNAVAETRHGEQAANAIARYVRAKRAPLLDVAELARAPELDAATLAKLAPYLCVLGKAAVLNPNTLSPQRAALLTSVIEGLSVRAAEEALRLRPRGGWRDVDQFLSSAPLARLSIDADARAAFAMSSTHYAAVLRLDLDGEAESSVVLFKPASGGVRVVRRVFGVTAWEHVI